jgi:serine/threonine protein kinase/CHASE2 domain-containing sensor protein
MERKRWFQVGRLLRSALRRATPRRDGSPLRPPGDDNRPRDDAEPSIRHLEKRGNATAQPGADLNVEVSATEERGPQPTLSHYRILRKLGEGGMGVVYEAEDIKLGRLLALKFLHPDASGDKQALERFRVEAWAVSAINHPNICTIYEIDECDGRTFIAMEFLEGQTLRQLLRGRALRAENLLNLAIQLADGLEAAHAKGIVHRDIKPENLFVVPQDRLKILDFGLAKFQSHPRDPARASGDPDLTTRPARDRLTMAGVRMGTPAYMSPEQVRGEELDSRTDLFSFGAVLFEMATGRRAFAGRSPADTSAAILGETPVLPLTLDLHLRTGLQDILNKALEKTGKFRYQHASDIAADLRRLGRGLGANRPAVSTVGPAALPPATTSLGRNVAGDLIKAAALSALVLAAHDFLERRPSGKYLGQFQLAFVQENLKHGPLDEADFEAGGRHLPLIVDISALHPDKKQPTDRKVLDLLIDELRRRSARAIGVDLAFDDLEGADFQYLEKWTGHKNVRIGIYRRAVEKRETWLGRPEFSDLAAGIALPKDNPQQAFFYSRRWFLKRQPAGPVAGPDDVNPRDCADSGPAADCKEDLVQLPVAMWLLSERQRISSEELAESDGLEARLKKSLHALQLRSSERAVGNVLEFGEYSIDYSYLKETKRNIIPVPRRAGESRENAIAFLEDYDSRIADRVVFVGDLKDTSDQFCQTPGAEPVPGVLIHACALATLNRGMLFEITDPLSWTTILGGMFVVLAAIIGLRVFHTRSRLMQEWPFQYIEILVFGAMAILVFLVFTWHVRVAGVVWPHYLWLSGALFVHPFFSEPFYRAVVATPKVLHAAVSTVAGRA